jgi:transcriptional regulator with PAS, ATPase and Fis domain
MREDIPKNQQHYSESIIRRAIEMQSPLILDDASANPEFREAKSVIVGQLKSVLVLPLFFEKRPIAVIYLENRNQTQYFAAELLEILNLFSTQGAILLHAKMTTSPLSSTSSNLALGEHSKSPVMQKVLQQAQSAAKAESNVLLLGETGVGKEVMARAVHQASTRSKGPFVPVNCTAIPETLIESELFGYKKGAFTGALGDREGLIRKAHRGTLFLDEIGDLPLHMQAKLLRVIQEKKFIRVGGNSEEESDFRLVCATHRALEESVNQGFFRQDLYFRINTITLSIPPLRQRAEDILDLAQAFLIQAAEENKRSVKKLDEGAAALLVNHEWPGNIRQLQNAIQRAVALVPPEAANAQLTAADFQFLSKKPTSEPLTKLQEAKEDFIRDYVKKAILIHKGNKTKAAKALGVDPKTLYRHLLEDRDGSEET